MKTLEEGTTFALESFKGDLVQPVRFTSKENGKYIDGTTNEEVVQMMIERYFYLQDRSPSSENSVIILLLKLIRNLQQKRTTRKIERQKRYGTEKNTSGK